jgi:hypothetical protein
MTTILGTDADGFLSARSGAVEFRLSQCCGKDATTEEIDGEWETVCRKCKQPVPEELACSPVPPYTRAETCPCGPGAHADGEPGGFYVTARDGRRTAWLLGPYTTHGEALDRVADGSRLARQADDRAAFYAFGTTRIVSGPRPAGVLNSRLEAAS